MGDQGQEGNGEKSVKNISKFLDLRSNLMPEQPKRGRTSEHLANLEALDKHLAETMPRSPAVSSLSGASLSQEDLRSLEKLKQEMGADFVGAEDWQNLLKVSAEGAV